MPHVLLISKEKKKRVREREKKKKTYDLVFKSKHIKHTHTKKEKDICGLQRRVSTVSKKKKKKKEDMTKKKKKSDTRDL